MGAVTRQLEDLAQFKGDSLTPDDIERIARRALAEIESLRAALRPFAVAWGDEMFLWSNDDLERFRRDGVPTSNPRYGRHSRLDWRRDEWPHRERVQRRHGAKRLADLGRCVEQRSVVALAHGGRALSRQLVCQTRTWWKRT